MIKMLFVSTFLLLNLQPWEDLAHSQQICTDKSIIGLRWSEESIRMVILDNRSI